MAEGSSARLRLAAAIAATVVLAALVGLVVLLGGGSAEHSFEAAPPECVDAWNEDPQARRLGQHQYATHLYENVQVLTLSADFAEPVPAGEPGARCAAIFAALSLDAEVSAAASVNVRGRWAPLSGYQPHERLAAMQAEAQRGYNTELLEDGTLEPLE